MPNLMLTNRCNYNCSYCFGMDMMAPAVSPLDMSMETLKALMAWTLKDSEFGHPIHLMGGEPTLNRDFVRMAHYVLEQECKLKVFSNLASRDAPAYAEALRDQEILWVVNVNPPEDRGEEQDRNLRRSLKTLGEKAVLTFNMTPEPRANGWVLDLINEYGLQKTVKVGFVLPTLSHRNEHLKKDDYPKVARRVVDFARRCEGFEVTLNYECGVPWCAFTADQMGELWHLNSAFHSSCDSIMDVTPDGRVIYCLPLASFQAPHFTKFDNYQKAKTWYESTLNPLRQLGSTSKCHECIFLRVRKDACRGGCMARILHGSHNVHQGVI